MPGAISGSSITWVNRVWTQGGTFSCPVAFWPGLPIAPQLMLASNIYNITSIAIRLFCGLFFNAAYCRQVCQGILTVRVVHLPVIAVKEGKEEGAPINGDPAPGAEQPLEPETRARRADRDHRPLSQVRIP